MIPIYPGKVIHVLAILFSGVIIFFTNNQFLHFVGGSLLILFYPGYLLLYVLFPTKNDLNNVWRFSLLLPTSIVIVSAPILLVNYLGLYSVEVLIIGLVVLNLLLVFGSILRFNNKNLDDQENIMSWIYKISRERFTLDKLVFIMAFCVLIGSIFYAAFIPKNPLDVTEFYLLDSSGLAANLPKEIFIDKPVEAKLGVSNWEQAEIIYKIEIWVVDYYIHDRRKLVLETGQFVLSPGKTMEGLISWKMPWTGTKQKVEFLLYKQNQQLPYRSLSLWLDVKK